MIKKCNDILIQKCIMWAVNCTVDCIIIYHNLQQFPRFVFVGLYNKTSLTQLEFRTYFNIIFPIMAFYYSYVKPDKINEISEIALKRYFPSGNIEDDSHMEAVQVRNYLNTR